MQNFNLWYMAKKTTASKNRETVLNYRKTAIAIATALILNSVINLLFTHNLLKLRRVYLVRDNFY
jgi:hypothetical protein